MTSPHAPAAASDRAATVLSEWPELDKRDYHFPRYLENRHNGTIFTLVQRNFEEEVQEGELLDREIGGLLLNRPTSFISAARADASTTSWHPSKKRHLAVVDSSTYTGITPIEPWIRIVVESFSHVTQRAASFFKKLRNNLVTSTKGVTAALAGKMMQGIVSRWAVVPENHSLDTSTAPMPPTSPTTQTPSMPTESPPRLDPTNPSPISVTWVRNIGSWALDSTLATPQFLPGPTKAAVDLWEKANTRQLESLVELDKPFARPFHHLTNPGNNDTETGLQEYLYRTWIPAINALLSAAVKAKCGDDTAAHVFRETDLPQSLRHLWRSDRQDSAPTAEGPDGLQNASADMSDRATNSSAPPHKGKSADFFFVVQRKGYESRIIAIIELKPWVTLQFLAYVFFELAEELVRGAATDDGVQNTTQEKAEGAAQTASRDKETKSLAGNDVSEKTDQETAHLQSQEGSTLYADGHSRAPKGHRTKGCQLLDQLSSYILLSRAPLCILLTTYQVVVLQTRFDKTTKKYDVHLQRTAFGMSIPETFMGPDASVTADPGCSGVCGHRFTVETSVNPICALFAVLMGGVQLYLEEKDSYVDDLTADLARVVIISGHGQANRDDDAGVGRGTRPDEGAEAPPGPSTGGTSSSASHTGADSAGHHSSPSDRDRSCDQLAVVYRRWPQAEGRDGSIHIGCLMAHAAAQEIFEATEPFCCPRTSLFSQRHTSEGISAEGQCSVKGHTSVVVKFANLFFAEDDGDDFEDEQREGQAVIAVQQDADNLDSIRKASREIAQLVPQPLGTFVTAEHGRKGFVYTNAGWAFSEHGIAGVLDLDGKGRKAILAAIRYVFQALHHSGWVHGDVAERNICVRFCHIDAKDNAAAGQHEESVEQETEGPPGLIPHNTSPNRPSRRSDRGSEGVNDARWPWTSQVQPFTQPERPSTPDHSTMNTRSGGLTQSTSNTSVSTGAGKDRDFPREACVMEKDRILQIRLIDFSSAKRLSGSELADACKEEMAIVADMLEDFESRLARAWERNRAAEAGDASAPVASPRP